MAFYTDISSYYDDLFPVSPAQRSLLEALRVDGGVRSVVDCGCGTGAQLLPFAGNGVACLGFDPDPSLVAIARRKLEPFPKARIEEGGFADLRRLSDGASDLLLCLGNSIVHVPQADAGRFLADASAALAPGGVLALQLLNYERLFRDGISELPLIRLEDGEVEFRRYYDWESRTKVSFRTALRVATAEGPKIVRNEIPLYPLFPDEVWEMAADAGFREIRFYGDFGRGAFSEESEAVVCLAKKP
ncbi:MAG: class I SAM-dependent methyltransferase [Verrucomicrobiota bacterium]